MDDKFLKRLRKKAKKGLRGWPLATVAFYGPDLGFASKVTVCIMPARDAPASELRSWYVTDHDIRNDPAVAAEMIGFIAEHNALSVGMAESILGCPHQQGIDYDGDWCPDPGCRFWHGRDRWTGKMADETE
jgi:hypothetical protein